jgi:hypothetical protein
VSSSGPLAGAGDDHVGGMARGTTARRTPASSSAWTRFWPLMRGGPPRTPRTPDGLPAPQGATRSRKRGPSRPGCRPRTGPGRRAGAARLCSKRWCSTLPRRASPAGGAAPARRPCPRAAAARGRSTRKQQGVQRATKFRSSTRLQRRQAARHHHPQQHAPGRSRRCT